MSQDHCTRCGASPATITVERSGPRGEEGRALCEVCDFELTKWLGFKAELFAPAQDLERVNSGPFPPDAVDFKYRLSESAQLKMGGRSNVKAGLVVFDLEGKQAEAFPQTLFRIDCIAAWGSVSLVKVQIGHEVVWPPADALTLADPAPAGGAPGIDPEALQAGWVQEHKTCNVGQSIKLFFDGPAPDCCAFGLSVW